LSYRHSIFLCYNTKKLNDYLLDLTFIVKIQDFIMANSNDFNNADSNGATDTHKGSNDQGISTNQENLEKQKCNHSTPDIPEIPIAICGMGLRLPGGIRNDADLYQFLLEKRDARSIVPKTRYDIEKYYNEQSKRGTIISKYGYFLDDDLTKFDLSMFSVTSIEASRLDPTQRLLLEVVREAFENSGEADFRGKNIGTFTSMFAEDWRDLQTRDIQDMSPYQLTGMLDFMLGNRIAYEYDLKGPSFTVKAACSSSGLALHQALQAIRPGEISAAIVAGGNLLFAPSLSITMSATGALSPTGSCKTFDASADGYGRAEGISCLYVKRLDEAIRDGNPIRAVIRASASLIRQAYKNLSFRDTAMVEFHGTGTVIGDVLEVSAVANCLGRKVFTSDQ
jgi:acyl transferase domain-containing protein